ncbi:IPT/TIG domain-containing protein [Myxococcota bacterium]|nr:IPT/TIG domain-containing protein [Myxococcota bacterium]
MHRDTTGPSNRRTQSHITRRAAAVALALASACGGSEAPTELDADVILSALVVTQPGTYFYPPLAPTPTPTGTFDATLLPQLSVILEATDVSGNTTILGTFTQSTTPALQLMLPWQQYFVNVPAPQYFTNPALAYRFRLMWGTQQLGFADVSSYVFTVMQTVPNLLFGVKVRIETRPAPILTAITPPTGEAGGPTFTLTLYGQNFQPDSVVYFDGVPVATTYVSPGVLTAVIPGGSYPTVGNYPVWVNTPGPGGGDSNTIDWIATPPPPSGPTYCGLPLTTPAAPTGAHQWSQRYGDGLAQTAIKVVGDPAGNVITTGFFYGSVDFGGGPLTAPSNAGFAKNQFVVKQDAAGNHVWSRQFTATTYMTPSSLGVDCDGSVYVAGWYDGTVDFGGGPLTGNGNNEIYLVKLDANGNHVWSRSFGDGNYQWIWHLAVDSQGNVIVVGGNDGTVDFGGGPLTSLGSEDGFVAKFDTNGNHVWSRSIGSAGYEFVYAVGVDAQDRVFVTGNFENTVDFGGVVLANVSGWDVFVAAYDPMGNAQWVRQFNTPTEWAYFYAVSGDVNGNVVAVGTFSGSHDFGAGAVTSSGGDDLVFVKLGPAGNTLWSTVWGSPALYEGVEGLAIDAAGNAIAGGSHLVKVDATGAVSWSRSFQQNPVRGLGVDPSGNVLVTGEMDLSDDFGGGALTSAGATDVFIVKYAP